MSKIQVSPLRAAVEVGFIIFLFYANLLMGEFTERSGRGKSWGMALWDIVTPTNFGIALVSAIVGYVGFEALRRRV
jgi:hypothetical protein